MVTVSTRPEPGSRVVLEIEVPPAEVDRHFAQAYRRVAQQSRVPGFRPGKAPRAIIDRYVGRATVLAETIDELVNATYDAAIEQADVVPIDTPSVDLDPGAVREGAPVRYTATVSVRPEVKLGSYADYPFGLESPEVTDAQVDALVEQLREGQASLRPVDDRPAAAGDFATVSMRGTIDGEPFEGGQSDRLPLILGEGRMLPGFEERVIGMRVDEERRFELDFPADYRVESLRGRRAAFEVKLIDLREKQLPELDDAFAASVSDGATVDSLRAEVRQALAARAADDARHAFADRIIEYATANATVELPEVLVANEIEIMRDELRSRLAQQRIGLDQYLDLAKQIPEELAAEFREPAIRRVKSLLVLSAIAEREGIDATDEEVAAEVAAQLERHERNPKLAAYLGSARGRSYLRMTIRNRKLVEALIERAIGHGTEPATGTPSSPRDAGGAE